MGQPQLRLGHQLVRLHLLLDSLASGLNLIEFERRYPCEWRLGKLVSGLNLIAFERRCLSHQGHSLREKQEWVDLAKACYPSRFLHFEGHCIGLVEEADSSGRNEEDEHHMGRIVNEGKP